MKLKTGILLFIILLFNAVAQEKAATDEYVYTILNNIPYRDSLNEPVSSYALERCRLDLYYPMDREKYPTVVWFHGGGLKAGEKYFPREIMDQGIAIAAVNYRLSPQIKNPVYIDDAAAAVAWIFKNIELYGGDSSLIFVSGHSAGGYLTSMIGMDKKWLAEYGIDADRIAGLIPFSGHTITHFTIREEMGIPGTQPIIDEFAPLFHVRADAPPLLLITGDREKELLGRYEENAYMMRMMKVAGHDNTFLYELKGKDHVTMLSPGYSYLIEYINKSTADSY